MVLYLKRKKCFACAGYLFKYALAKHLVYPQEAGLTCFFVVAASQQLAQPVKCIFVDT
jgi:hypothetical protein